MIGLSLSFCIQDVIEGRMPVEAIDSLITGTMAETVEEWQELLDRYCAVYWRKDPVRARRIVTALRALGKIDQPRTRGAAPPDHRRWPLDRRPHRDHRQTARAHVLDSLLDALSRR